MIRLETIIISMVLGSTIGITLAMRFQTTDIKEAIEEMQSDFRIAQFKSCYITYKDGPACAGFSGLTEEDTERLK